MLSFTQEQIEIIAKGASERILENREKADSLIADYSYIDWLERFTLNNPKFADDTWLYSKDKILEEDYEYVKKLPDFYTAILNYCERFNVTFSFSDEYEFGRFYINHNGVGYRLSLFCGQGAYVMVWREEKNIRCISFSAIVNNIAPF